MRKRLGILILIFCLLLIFPIQQSKGQSLIDTDVLSERLALIILSIWGLTPESWNGDCDMYFHPGDYYYEKNYKIIKPIKMKAWECYKNCTKKSMDMNVAMGSLRSNKGVSHNQCYNPCAIDAYKPFPTSVATCKDEGIYGYYSDGSYYNSHIIPNYPSFDEKLKNIHKLKDKYS